MANSTSSPVCLITGGASGMGLAVAEKLASLGWYLTVVDYNEKQGKEVAERLGDKVIFLKANVADYDELASTFKETWETRGRLDVVYNNAGIGDKIDFYAPAVERDDGTPAKPDTTVVDVDLMACIYGTYLAMHYMHKNPNKKGKIVYTSSMCGLYSGDMIPLYTAAKHGVVGLTYATARALKGRGEDITVNCICPGLVFTGLTGPLQACPSEYVTPTSTIVRAFESFINDDSRTAQLAECSGLNIHYKSMPGYSDKAAEYIMDSTVEDSLHNFLMKLKAKH